MVREQDLSCRRRRVIMPRITGCSDAHCPHIDAQADWTARGHALHRGAIILAKR
jgi:hypothetical protein